MLNKKIFAKNFVYTFSSNIVTFLLNAIILMILPKVITTVDYGYFQYYIMIVAYTIFSHFGWIDGIYLKYSGKNYENLDKKVFSGQFRYLFFLGIIQSVVFTVIIYSTPLEVNKKYAIFIAVVAIIFVIPKTFAYVLMQVTSRFKEYSRILIIEKVVFGIILIIMLALGVRTFSILILSDLIARVIASLYGCYCCYDIIKTKANSYKEIISESLENIKSGIFIMVSNISSVLIAGIVQLIIEYRWDIQTFGKVSLTFNISKAILVVISAVGIIIFPILKRVDQRLLDVVYKQIRILLSVILFVLIICYYPLAMLLDHWLPQYRESVTYMAILFPMCVYESKTSLLLNTYFKLLRKERALALINVIVVVLSVLLSIISAYIFNSLYITVLMILILLGTRSIILELYIIKHLKISGFKNVLIDTCIITLFILFNIATSYYISGVLYLAVIIIYIFAFRKNISRAIKFMSNGEET